MKNLAYYCMVLAFFLTASGASIFPQSEIFKIEDGWKGIRIFHSNESDVVKRFGKGEKFPGILATFYRNDSEQIVVYDAGAPCSNLKSYRTSYNVPTGTVLELVVNLGKPIPITQMVFTRDQYQAGSAIHGTNRRNYYSRSKRLWIEVTLERDVELVTSIRYWPTVEIENTFRCKPLD